MEKIDYQNLCRVYELAIKSIEVKTLREAHLVYVALLSMIRAQIEESGETIDDNELETFSIVCNLATIRYFNELKKEE